MKRTLKSSKWSKVFGATAAIMCIGSTLYLADHVEATSNEPASQITIPANWKETKIIEEGTIPLANNQKVSYHFGSVKMIGAPISQINGVYSSTLATPRVELVSGLNRYTTLAENGDAVNTVPTFIAQKKTSTIPAKGVALNQFNPSAGSQPYQNIKVYKQVLSNGLTALKMDMNVTYKANASTNLLGLNLKYSSILYPTPDGTVYYKSTITNNSATALTDVIWGAVYGTETKYKEAATLNFIGDNKGLYTAVADKKLGYYFDEADNFDNWNAEKMSEINYYTGNSLGMPAFIPERFFGYSGFKTNTAVGQEALNAPANSVAKEKVSSAIWMKTQPFSLKKGESKTTGYQVKVVD